MADIEYFRGLPEVGIVPRAPHGGPLLEHLYEQEHGCGGLSGRVSHTYHLYPPTNWLPGETAVVEGSGTSTLETTFGPAAYGPGDYMTAWSAYTTDQNFAYAPGRFHDVRAEAERLAGARD